MWCVVACSRDVNVTDCTLNKCRVCVCVALMIILVCFGVINLHNLVIRFFDGMGRVVKLSREKK